MMKLRAMTILVIFVGILYLPFAINAASGNIFNGVPKPDLRTTSSAGQGSSQSNANQTNNAAAKQYSAAADQYGAAGSQYNGAASQQTASAADAPSYNNISAPAPSIDLDYMRDHMNRLKEDGQSTKMCSSCHTNRADFCDKCHSFAGVNPKIDF